MDFTSKTAVSDDASLSDAGLCNASLGDASLGIDIGSTTVKIAILDEEHNILFCDYQRHYANIRETLAQLLEKAYHQLGNLTLHPMITGSGGLTLANCLGVPFIQEVIAVSSALQELAPLTDVAIAEPDLEEIFLHYYTPDAPEPDKEEP